LKENELDINRID